MRNLHFENWEVTPGQGGVEHLDRDGGHLGGGGGGVLANGKGPERRNYWQGEGYGGGGGGGMNVQGLSGVVIIEIFTT